MFHIVQELKNKDRFSKMTARDAKQCNCIKHTFQICLEDKIPHPLNLWYQPMSLQASLMFGRSKNILKMHIKSMDFEYTLAKG